MSAMKRHAAYVDGSDAELMSGAVEAWGSGLPDGFTAAELRARCEVAGVFDAVGFLDEVEQLAGELEAGEFEPVRKSCGRCGVDMTRLAVESTTIVHGDACRTDDGLVLFTINWALS